MRLCATGRTVRRTWTVELRPQRGGPVMACPDCPTASRPLPLGTAAVRPAVVGHLAAHARSAALPTHLRTCQCHARGCHWHPRHRGCSGAILLVLTCERGGRLWRLTDACSACAHATAHSAIVPEAAFTVSALPAPPRRSRRREQGPGAAVRIREMLSYLAAALPAEVGAAARLLALQGALRTTASGRLHLPAGLLRSMRLDQQSSPWQELEQPGWLIRLAAGTTGAPCGVTAQLLDAAVLTQAPRRQDRAHAADKALRLTSCRALRNLPAADQLTALALVTHLPPGSLRGAIEAERIGRVCAAPPDVLASTLDRLVAAGAADWWSYDQGAEEIAWALGPTLVEPHANVSAEQEPSAVLAGPRPEEAQTAPAW
ncbi:hypothetical protein BKA18_000046 [Streptomyces auratus]